MHHARRFWRAALAVAALAAPAAAQNVWYVDAVNGSDADHGLFPSAAFRHINFALGVASPGDTVNVLPGVYVEDVVLTTPAVKLEALPAAVIRPAAFVALEIHSGLAPLGRDTLVRGFTLEGGMGGVGIWVHNAGTGNEVAPTIEANVVNEFSFGVIVTADGPDALANPLLRYNTVQTAVECAHPYSLGVTLETYNGGTNTTHLRSNRIFHHEWGVGVFDHFDGTCTPLLECDVIAYCEWGVLVDGNTGPELYHETIGIGSPASAVGTVYGIQSTGPTVPVFHSIVWLPSGIGCDDNPFEGIDLDGPVVVDSYTIVEDLHPTLDPQFVDPSPFVLDFHLTAGSPAIDRGDASLIGPFGAHPIDFDLDGAPRLQDPFRSGVLEVDVGAHEFATVALDVFDPADVANSSGRPYVMARLGGSIVVQLQGQPGDLAILWWTLADSYGTNFLHHALGNLLVPFTFSLPLPLDPSGAVSLPAAMPPNGITEQFLFQELQLHLQAALFDPTAANPHLGGFTRRVILELNPQ